MVLKAQIFLNIVVLVKKVPAFDSEQNTQHRAVPRMKLPSAQGDVVIAIVGLAQRSRIDFRSGPRHIHRVKIDKLIVNFPRLILKQSLVIEQLVCIRAISFMCHQMGILHVECTLTLK